MRSGGALAGGGPGGVGVKVGVEVGEAMAVGIGDIVFGIGGNAAVGVVVAVAVGGKRVKVGGMGLAEGVGVISPPPDERGG